MTKGKNGAGRETLVLGIFGKVATALAVAGIIALIASERASAVQMRAMNEKLAMSLEDGKQRDEVIKMLTERVWDNALEIDRLKRPHAPPSPERR